jgi:hypothetical protein
MFTQIEDASRLAVPTNLSPAWRLVEATEAAAPSATEAATAASSALIVRHITLLLSPRPIARLTRRRTRMWRRAKEPTSCSMSSIRHHSSLGEVSAKGMR